MLFAATYSADGLLWKTLGQGSLLFPVTIQKRQLNLPDTRSRSGTVNQPRNADQDRSAEVMRRPMCHRTAGPSAIPRRPWLTL
jgi:hypothetical protein